MFSCYLADITGIYAMKDFDFNNIRPVILKSVITCPKCGFQKEEKMPENACTFFYECEKCHAILKPQKGDCCVFCSFGTVACPPIQVGENCC